MNRHSTGPGPGADPVGSRSLADVVAGTLCVIPARGGSKGIVGKNLRRVAGRPLIGWTIDQALAVPGLRVLVSTDDPEIAEVSRAAGAQVPWLRPAELAQDSTPTEPVVRHAIDAEAAAGRHPDQVLLLQATSPIRRPGSIAGALAQFARSGVDSLVAVVPQAPFLWSLGGPGEAPSAAYDPARRPRRQDLTETTLAYRETGSLYVTRTSVYLEQDNRIGGRVGLYVMDEVEGVDIDTEFDLALAERFLAPPGEPASPEAMSAPGAAR